MSMEHQAFLFDWSSFTKELSTLLNSSLKTDDSEILINFIKTNFNTLKDPYTGELLSSNWQEKLEIKDVPQYGHLALTKFYQPCSNIGLGYSWIRIQELLDDADVELSLVLGEPFGPDYNYFDPGKMGTYFQSEKQVKKNLQQLNEFVEQNPSLSSDLGDLRQMLKLAEKAHMGLFITIV